jgi:hypothetical protein
LGNPVIVIVNWDPLVNELPDAAVQAGMTREKKQAIKNMVTNTECF